MIDRYLAEVEQTLRLLRPFIAHEALTIERPEGVALAYLKGRLTFLDGSQLAIVEIVGAPAHVYRFHYMDRQQRLLLRWDTAPHHRQVNTFPFHVHTHDGVRESQPVTLPVVLRLIHEQLMTRLGSV